MSTYDPPLIFEGQVNENVEQDLIYQINGIIFTVEHTHESVMLLKLLISYIRVLQCFPTILWMTIAA